MIKYQNTTNKMAVCYDKITNLTLRSKFTNNGLWTHGPIWPWSQNSRSKVTNNGTRHIVWGWSTYMPNMKSLSWTTKKSYSPDTICYGSTDQFDLKFKVKGHQQWYATHRLEVVYLHANYAKPVLKDKKVTAPTRF